MAQSYPALARYWPHLSEVSLPQAAMLLDDRMEVFYGGAAGGGKSDALLAGAFQYADVPGFAALILRRTFADLSKPGAAIPRSKQWLRDVASWNETLKTWTFPSGATLTFGYLDSDDDRYQYQSSEFQYIGFDELTQFTEKQYRYLFSRLRAVEAIPVPLRMRSASNPGGVGHGWVKRRFITQRDPQVRFIPAKLEDHPDESFKQGYRMSLSNLDDLTRRQYEDGDWDVAEGLAFNVAPFSLIPDLEIPESWERFESMDFGVANPTVVLAWATDYDGNLIVFDSYYKANTLVADHAAAIEARRLVWGTSVCYADPSMWARTGAITRFGQPATDVTEFDDLGISGLVQANNKRRPGRIRLTELLRPDPARRFPDWHYRAGEPGSPQLFIVTDRCPQLVTQLTDAPLMPIDSGKEGAGEIVDPQWESQDGHAVAACRYGAMSRPDASTRPLEEPDDYERWAKQDLLARHEQRRDGPKRIDRDRYVTS
jgi:hypothetical protein